MTRRRRMFDYAILIGVVLVMAYIVFRGMTE
jgi:hypothetical protein